MLHARFLMHMIVVIAQYLTVSLAGQIDTVRLLGIICSHSSECMNYKPGCGLSCCKMGKEKMVPLLEENVFLFSCYCFELENR